MTELPLKAALRALEPTACPDSQQVLYDADGTLSVPHVAALSTAISLKRIADALDSPRSQGSVLYFLEQIASAANAGFGR